MQTTKAQIEAIVNELDLEQVRLYSLFEELGTMQAVAKIVCRSSNTVRDRMNAANKLFERTFGHDLLTTNRGHYELTLHGHYVAQSYPDLTDFIGRMVDRYRSAKPVYEVPCTMNTLPLFYDLAKAMPESTEFMLRPDPKRTADLQVHPDQPGPCRITFCSILASSDQYHSDEVVNQILPTIKMIVVESESLFLLGKKSLELPGEPDIATVISQGIKLLMPTDGVAWMFTQENAPQWHERNPHLHTPIPYKDYGLEMLRHENRAAMVLHGSVNQYLEQNPDMRIWPLHQIHNMEHKALTGLVIDQRVDMNEVHFEQIRDIALRVFGPDNHTEGDPA